MAKSGKRRTRTSPPAFPLTSTTTISTSSRNPASSPPYFLPELIPLVASHLTTLQDFFTLRAACRAYRARLPLSSSNLASQGQLLLVRHMDSTSEALFHVPLRRILRFRLPRSRIITWFRAFRRLLCADYIDITSFNSFGCRVVIQDIIGGSRQVLRIRHLLTRERARLPDLPECVGVVILSGDLVLTYTPWQHKIFYRRIGDAQWQATRLNEGCCVYSMIFVEGTLYVLIYPNYRLAVIELDNNSAVLSFVGDIFCSQPSGSTFWLAECRGDLLLIVRTGLYRVFRWQSGERKWARTDSLGGCSLFFNCRQFAGCLGPDHPGVRRNCLYFTGPFGNWSEYSLVDRSLHEIVAEYPGREVRKEYVPLAWVLPSIC